MRGVLSFPSQYSGSSSSSSSSRRRRGEQPTLSSIMSSPYSSSLSVLSSLLSLPDSVYLSSSPSFLLSSLQATRALSVLPSHYSPSSHASSSEIEKYSTHYNKWIARLLSLLTSSQAALSSSSSSIKPLPLSSSSSSLQQHPLKPLPLQPLPSPSPSPSPVSSLSSMDAVSSKFNDLLLLSSLPPSSSLPTLLKHLSRHPSLYSDNLKYLKTFIQYLELSGPSQATLLFPLLQQHKVGTSLSLLYSLFPYTRTGGRVDNG